MTTINISKGYADTPISGAQPITLQRPVINFKEDFRIKRNAESELTLINLTSPLDRTEKVRYSVQNVSNVYAGTDIDPSVYAPVKRGVSLLVQRTATVSVTDTNAGNSRIDLPVSFHIVAKVPVSEHVDADFIESEVLRTLSVMYETNSADTTRINAMLRGSLAPKDM